MVMSMLWGIFLFFACSFSYIYDLLINEDIDYHISPFINLTVTGIGIIVLTYFIIDIKTYVSKLERRAFGNINLGDLKLVEGEDGDWHVELPLPHEKKTLPEYYGFVSGRHAGSSYLKLAAGFFWTFHIIQLILNIIKRVVFSSHKECSDNVEMTFELLMPLFILLQVKWLFHFTGI